MGRQHIDLRHCNSGERAVEEEKVLSVDILYVDQIELSHLRTPEVMLVMH